MLTFFRAFAKSTAAKILLFVLVLGLAFTGGSAFFGGATSSGAFVQAGKYTATQPYFDMQLDGIRAQLNEQQQRTAENEITREQAVSEPFVVAEIKKNLSNRVLMLAYGKQIGFELGPDAATRALSAIPGFNDGLGRLDMQRVGERAQQLKFPSQTAFFEYVREGETVVAMQRAAVAGIRPPQILTRQFTDYLAEQRTIAIARVEPKNLPAIADPSEAVLRAHYDANKADYTVGETRAFEVVQYSPMDYVGSVPVAPEKIKAEYDRRIVEFSSPETRDISVVTAQNFNIIQGVIDQVKQGRPLADAVNANQGAVLETRAVQPNFTDNKELSNVVFRGMKAGDISPNPFRLDETSPFMAIRVNSVTPGNPFPLDDSLKGQIAVDIAFIEARRTYDALSTSVDDLATGAATMEQIADAVTAPLISLPPIAANGRTPENDPAILLLPYFNQKPDFHDVALRQAAFAMQPGGAPLVVEAKFCPAPSPADRDGCRSRLILQLASVHPAFTRPFEEVRKDVLEDWRGKQQREAVTRSIEGVVAAVKGGQTLEAAAKTAKMIFMPFPQPIDRNVGGFLGEAGMEAVFALPKGGVASVTLDQSPDPIVVQVLDIQRIDPAQNPQLMIGAQNEVRQTLTQDLLQGLLASAAAKVKVTENTAVIDAYVLRASGKDQQQPQR